MSITMECSLRFSAATASKPCGKRQGFCFVNGDENDFRYSNLKIINPYFGVERIDKNGTEHYKVRIHIHGNITVGNYTNAN